jgi:hypothetical protein
MYNLKSRAKFWTCFNYIINKKILKLKFVVINFYGFENHAHFNLHPICKHWYIAHKLKQFLKKN